MSIETKTKKARAAAEAPLVPSDYVAKVPIWDANNHALADVGDTCEKVSAASLVWLLAQGHIAHISTKTPHEDEADA